MQRRQIVVFTGPTGVKKKTCLGALIRRFLEGRKLPIAEVRDEELVIHPEVQRYIRHFFLEEEVEEFLQSEIMESLARPSY